MKLWLRLRAVFQLEGRSVAQRAAATVVVALVLLLLQSLLYLPDGTGIESFLGELGQKAVEQLESWRASRRLPFAGLYLAADTLFFVPVYAAFGLALARAVRDHSEYPQQGSLWWSVLEAPLLVLVLVDLAENALGLARLGAIGVVTAVGVTAVSVLVLARLPELRTALRAAPWMRYAVLAAAAVALLVGVQWHLMRPAAGPVFTGIAVGAHRAKVWLAPLAFGALALAGLAWLFGVDRLLTREGGDVASRRAQEAARERANLRGVIWDLLGRSRYVILTLALIGVLVAGMDQARDVLYAMAASAFREGPEGWKATLGSLAALIALAFSTGGLEYSCWLWTRSVGQILPSRLEEPAGAPLAGILVENAPPPAPVLHPLADGFAKYWARALAFVPIVLFVGLHARVVRDGVMSGVDGQPPRMGPVFVVLAAGAALILFGAWLLWRHGDPRSSQAGCYYSALNWREWAASIGLFTAEERPRLKYRMLFRHVRVYWLPLLLGAGLLVCRLVDVFPPHWWLWQEDYIPSLSLAVVQFSLALWLCLFGWLSVLETRQTIPWLVPLVALVGWLGFRGVTDNHVIWPALAYDLPLPGPPVEEWALLRMLGFTSLLLLLLLSAYALAIWAARRRSRREPAFWYALCGALALCGVTTLVLLAANARASSRAPTPGKVLHASQRPTLDQALTRWLKTFCPDGGACPAEDPFPVYFVSTEGGGIRAAAWTAFTLDALATSPQFLARTFSISGVSGGAVGAAAFRACSVEQGEPSSSKARWDCLQHFAATDQLSPLLSAWMFEDVLARVVPTRWCSVPGCGVLSRGAWFEQALEIGAPGLRRGLFESSGWRRPPLHVPYLLLNATWVESGDRAIASDLSVTRETFPDARDQLELIGTDLPLATAAHNAARFPFINPIGSLHADPAVCAPCENANDPKLRSAPCGHLADGGYFDNSGAQSTLDVVNGLAACLSEPGNSDGRSYPDCRGLGAERRLWLRQHLVPQILMIRNDVDLEYSDENYLPEQVPEPPASNLFSGALGPAIAIFNVSGIGANRRLAEARQAHAVQALRARWQSAASSVLPAVRSLDLIPDGTLYPLGWHLSQAAIDGMRVQAACQAPP